MSQSLYLSRRAVGRLVVHGRWIPSALLPFVVLCVATPVALPSELLYRQTFEPPAAIRAPDGCWETGCWQELLSREAAVFPPQGARAAPLDALKPVFMLITQPLDVTAASMGEHMQNRIEPVDDGTGGTTSALYQVVHRSVNDTRPMGTASTQNELLFVPAKGAQELYVRFRLRLQPDLVERMSRLPEGPGVVGGGTWRAVFGMKTGTLAEDGRPRDDGDYRLEAYVMTYDGHRPTWVLIADNNAGGDHPATNDWTVVNRGARVPVGEWFLFEIYWRRSAANDGLVWMAVDCRPVVDRSGPNIGAGGLPVNRIMAPLLYAGGKLPAYQWVDDLEIHTGIPERRCP